MALKFINTDKSDGLVFNVITNQAYNRTLKEALKEIKFNRNITSHVARHTFITISIQKGMRKELTGRIAGHRKSNTTEGYTHLNINDLFNELQKWN